MLGVQYIVMQRQEPFGDEYDEAWYSYAGVYASPEMARHVANQNPHHPGRALECVLADLRDIDATLLAEHHERMWQHHFTEYMRITGKEPIAVTLTAVEVAKLRSTALTWMQSPPDDEAAHRGLWLVLKALFASGKLEQR